jgi:hypothetical protein
MISAPPQHTQFETARGSPPATGRAHPYPVATVVSATFWIAFAILVLWVPLLIVPRAPWISAWWSGLLGAITGLGNLALHWLLQRPPTAHRRVQVDMVIEIVGSVLCAGILAIWIREADSLAPIALVAPPVCAAAQRRKSWLRFGRAVGLVAALLGAQAAAQIHLGILAREDADDWGLKWALILGTVAAGAGIASRWHEQHRTLRPAGRAITTETSPPGAVTATREGAAALAPPAPPRTPPAELPTPGTPPTSDEVRTRIAALSTTQLWYLLALMTSRSHDEIAVAYDRRPLTIESMQSAIAATLGVGTGEKGDRSRLRAQ